MNLAARLADAARACEVLVAGAAGVLDASSFAVEPLAPMTLRGFPDAVPVAAVRRM